MRYARTVAAMTGLVLALAASATYAHPLEVMGTGFGAGFGHPFLGLDHLAAMIAVGVWAAQAGWRPVWGVPLVFMTVMAFGAVLAFAGIAASVLVLGLLIAAAVRLPATAGAAIVAVFAVFHGHAHGSEIPQALAPWLYAAGFLLATAVLHATGIVAGRQWTARQPWLARTAGLALSAGGAWMLLG
jgi:urease accessory protein